MAVVLIQVLTISFRTVSSCLVWKISMQIKSRNLSRRMFSRPRAVRSRKFQNISLVTNRTCELHWDPESLLFLHWFHRLRIKMLRFRGLSFKKRYLRMTVLTEIEKLSRRMFSWMHNYSSRAVRSREFQKKSLVTRAELANLIETRRVYYFSTDSTAVGSNCFDSEAYHLRSVLCGWEYWQKSKRTHFSRVGGV